MTPADYDAWYDTARGRWIGETEFRLLRHLLDPQPGERLLDVGCGTGWFTRHFAAVSELHVTGIDTNSEWLNYARGRDARTQYLEGDACALPFADASFDRVVSVTALCFIQDWALALKEIARVTRTRFAVGVLNRASLLWRDKGRDGGSGAYRGAHWHTLTELRTTLAALPVDNVGFRTAIFMPSGSAIARVVELALPNRLPWGGFLVVTGEITRGCGNVIIGDWGLLTYI